MCQMSLPNMILNFNFLCTVPEIYTSLTEQHKDLFYVRKLKCDNIPKFYSLVSDEAVFCLSILSISSSNNVPMVL